MGEKTHRCMVCSQRLRRRYSVWTHGWYEGRRSNYVVSKQLSTTRDSHQGRRMALDNIRARLVGLSVPCSKSILAEEDGALHKAGYPCKHPRHLQRKSLRHESLSRENLGQRRDWPDYNACLDRAHTQQMPGCTANLNWPPRSHTGHRLLDIACRAGRSCRAAAKL